jgi:hypothetical protein
MTIGTCTPITTRFDKTLEGDTMDKICSNKRDSNANEVQITNEALPRNFYGTGGQLAEDFSVQRLLRRQRFFQSVFFQERKPGVTFDTFHGLNSTLQVAHYSNVEVFLTWADSHIGRTISRFPRRQAIFSILCDAASAFGLDDALSKGIGEWRVLVPPQATYTTTKDSIVCDEIRCCPGPVLNEKSGSNSEHPIQTRLQSDFYEVLDRGILFSTGMFSFTYNQSH